MSMFDSLFINTEKLPVTDDEKKIIGDNREWQTKNFDNNIRQENFYQTI